MMMNIIMIMILVAGIIHFVSDKVAKYEIERMIRMIENFEKESTNVQDDNISEEKK